MSNNDKSESATDHTDVSWWPVSAIIAFFTLTATYILGYFRYCGDEMALCEPPLYLTGANVVPVNWWLVAAVGSVGCLFLVDAYRLYRGENAAVPEVRAQEQ